MSKDLSAADQGSVGSAWSPFRHRSEAVATGAAIVSFFLIITAYYVLKPVRESLALELGATRIPALNIFSMFTLVFANGLYSWIISRYSRSTFIPAIGGFFLLCLGVFWGIFSLPEFQVTGKQLGITFRVVCISLFFIWLNLFILFAVSMFWSFVNDNFTSEQGKRLYSYIGMGGLCGGLLGGTITSALVSILGSSWLFLVAAAIYGPSLLCMYIIEKNPPGPGAGGKEPPSPGADDRTRGRPEGEEESGFSRAMSGARVTFNSTLLTLLALEMFLYTFGSTIFSFQINQLMENALQDRDSRILYWARMYNWVNGFSIISQIFLTTTVMKMARPWFGILLIPLWQIGGGIVLYLNPTLATAAAIGVVRYGMDYSLMRAVREYFYTAVTRDEKYQGKGFIDTMVFRAGDGVAASLLLSWTTFFSPTGWVDAFSLLPWCLAILVIVQAGQAFQDLLARKSGSQKPLTPEPGPA